MAVRPSLIALLALAVLLLHAVAVDWLAQAWQPFALKPLPKPMYTRQIRPEAPPEQKSVANAPEAVVQPTRPAITSIAESTDRQPSNQAAPKPKPAASDARTPADSPASPPQDGPGANGEADPAPARADATVEPVTAAATSSGPALPAETDAGPGPGSPSPDGGAPPALAASAAQAAVSAEAAPAVAPSDAGSWRDWPTDTRLTYALSGYYNGELHGSAQVLWQRDGSDYETTIEIDLGLLANIRLTSQGRITSHGLAPRVYEELQRTRRRGVRLEDGVVVLGDGKRVDRPAQVQDTASQFVELAHRFATGRVPLEPGRKISLWLARPGGVDSWTYDVVGQVTLPTPTLGPVEAYHLKPRPLVKPSGKYSAEIWFAPTLQYLPVRIKVSTSDSSYVDLIVKRIDQR